MQPRWLALAMMAALPAPAALAEPVTSETTRTYSVTGATPAALRASMNGQRPTDRFGQRFDALTVWRIDWHVQSRAAAHVCSIAGIKVEVAVVTTLPELTDETTPPRLRQRFTGYVTNLATHERGHRDNGVAAGREIERAILAMGGRPDCPTLLADANAIGRALIETARQRDVDYDAATAHGATQGARFP